MKCYAKVLGSNVNVISTKWQWWGRARRNLSNGPKDYHEIGQRHLKHQRLVACFRLVFRLSAALKGRVRKDSWRSWHWRHVCRLSRTKEAETDSPVNEQHESKRRGSHCRNTEGARDPSPHGVTTDTCQPVALPAPVRVGGRHHRTFFNRDSVQKGLGARNHDDLSDTGLHWAPTTGNASHIVGETPGSGL